MSENIPPSPSAPLGIIVEHARCVNFALQQNGVRFVRRIALVNRQDVDLEEIVVRVGLRGGGDEPLSRGWEARVARIAPGSTYNLPNVPLALAPAVLARQTERESVELVVEATSGGLTVGSSVWGLDVLAATEWAGGEEFPEMLAAFVTPNHPAIERLLVEAGALLRDWTGDATISGYQSKSPARARAIVAALYTAAARRGIGYVNPPASFEVGGQKVRLADQVLDGKLGTCLDLALVLAAAIEQAGLHPLIVVQRGHAFAGAWLVDETFPDPVVDTPSRLINRVELDEIVVVEATGIAASPAMDFDGAVARGRTLLGKSDDFRWALDVNAARRAMVRPLPVRVGGVGGVVLVAAESDAPEGAPASVREEDTPRQTASDTAATEAPRSRIDRWKRKLLDLSLRSRLINFRETAQSVAIECPDLAAMEDALAEGVRFELLAKPDALIRGGDVADATSEANAAAVEARQRVLREELANRRLRTTLAPAELATRLTGIYRAARSSIDENGANTLFLALGSLVWYESRQSETQRTAPLLMLPVVLERKSVNEGFRMVAADEEPRINITLVEKLSQEFGIDAKWLREVPEDDNGVDVAMVLRRFREAIKHIDRWEVRESAHLGLFTFSKFLMWLDLQEREEDLRRSKVVTYLVDRPVNAFDSTPFLRAERMDSEYPVDQSLGPLDADSSQLVAAASAVAGRTFVLEGPPGTGKSQTITNIIAQSVAAGKRVLFVAEKMAALSVVQKRLERVGLAPFCLEVHSSKTSKKEVLEQIDRAFEASQAKEPAQWRDHAEQLSVSRGELNRYVAALHTPRPIGRSFFEMAARLVGLAKAPDVELTIGDAAQLDSAFVTRVRQQLEALQLAGRAIGDVPDHPLREFGRGDWQDSLPDQARALIDRVTVAVGAALTALEGLARALGSGGEAMHLERWSQEHLQWLVRLGEHLSACPGVTMALLTDPGWAELKPQLETLITRGRERDAIRAGVLSKARPDVFDLDVDALIESLRAGMTKGWPLSWLACRSARKAVGSVWIGQLPDNAALVRVLEEARTCRDGTAWLQSEASEGARYLGRLYNGGETDWDSALRAVLWADTMRALSISRPEDQLGAVLRASAVRLATEGVDELRGGTIGGAMHSALSSWKAFNNEWTQLASLLAIPTDALPGSKELAFVPWLRGALARWRTALGELNDWCFWRRTRLCIAPMGAPVAAAVETGRIRCEETLTAFDKAITKAWVGAVSDQTPELRDFNVAAHEGQITRFSEMDRRWLELSAQIARARVAQRVPPRLNIEGGTTPATEMGVLAHQMRLQRRHMPVRRLIGKLPNLLPRLKPCFLMSPLSVAQYLDPAYPPFDIVVFDEASQIPVWDAVGAIARGASVVVVGDSKQLPPTNFFQKLDGEEGVADEDDFEELESVLDECIASGLPSMRLLWHYRSRHESLIAFSNHHYYQGRLLTFPAPEERSDGLGVSLRHVPGGTYDRGGARTNRAEAEAIVSELAGRLGSDAGSARRSIGIVTFSQAQQTLIEDLLDARRRENPKFDEAMNAGEEPVFVKNLENVQGDERDVILFSVCYAPDRTGRMAMSFGPLNRDGGERRLNVAVTRARRQVIVFSSIRAEQIDLTRTRAVGAAHLKSFLEYADRGPASMGEAAADLAAVAPTPLELSIRSELEARGWQVDSQVGCSGYRIDLAVRDPDRPGRYLLGIECDGAFYASASTARDRERLRGQVLAGLGWRMHRVWSAEWRRNLARAIQRIEDAIGAAQSGSPVPTVAPTPLVTPRAETTDPAPGPINIPANIGSTSPRAYTPYSARRAGDAEEFYKSRVLLRVAETIRAVVEHEGPIVRDLMARRVAAHWGLDRVTTRVEARLAEVMASAGRVVQIDEDGSTLWGLNASRDEFTTFRPHGDDEESRRDPEDLPTREVANAAAAVLRSHIAMSQDDLLRHTALAFGFARPTERTAAEMRRGLVDLAKRGGCEIAGAQVRLPR